MTRRRLQPKIAFCLWTLAAISGSARLNALPCDGLKNVPMQDGTIRLVQAVGAGSFTLPTSGETLPPAQRERLAQVFEKLPAFCRVDIEFKPAPQSDIRVEVWMPESAWNGRPLGVGNGGWGGVINYSGLAQGVMQGFAAASTDMGTAGFSAPDRTTWKILESDDRLVDFGSRATHLMTVAAKLLIQSFYGSSPHFSYWNGCSTGGKQGLAEAQRYPLDYNGIVEGDPASYFTHLMFSLQWYGAAARSVSASPMPASKFSALHQAVLKACDSSDGVADGIVSDPEHCNFDPRTIACKADDAPDCLTPAELKMVTAIYECAFNPRTGEQIFPGEEPGSELGWVGMLHVPGPTLTSLSYFQFALHRNPDWSPLSLNFDSDVADADRVDGATLNDIDADLHAFKAAGGKLIMFHGWSDPIIAPFESVHYYRSVVAAMGGSDQASSFVRLFMLPGVGHCQGGPGADNFDKIGLIEKWTESGLPPSAALVAHRDPPGSAFTRPLCPYPQSAFWRGTGDSNAAENFVCRDGTPANAHPAAFAASLMKK